MSRRLRVHPSEVAEKRGRRTIPGMKFVVTLERDEDGFGSLSVRRFLPECPGSCSRKG
jgi:hypothetical protein